MNWNQLMENLAAQSRSMFGADMTLVLKGLGILLVGWIVALILSNVVRGALRRTNLDNRVAGWISGDDPNNRIDIEAGAGRATFWLVMLFAVVAAFEAIRLTAVTGPLGGLLQQLTDFAPRLLSAALLLGIAWLIATGVKMAVTRAIASSEWSRKMLRGAGGDESDSASAGVAIGEALYWFVFLVFLPGVLNALALQGMLEPVQQMLNKITAFLPNIFAAAITLGIGWLLAKILRNIVTSFAAAIGVDAFGERVGLQSALGNQRLSGLLGGLVYALVLIPVLISALGALELDSVTAPLSIMLTNLLEAIPALFGAILILGLAYVLARVVSELVAGVLTSIGFNTVLAKLGFRRPAQPVTEPDIPGAPKPARTTPATVVGSIVLAVIMLFAAMEAAGMLGFTSLELIVRDLLGIAGHVLFGIVILGVGLYLANFAARSIRAAGTPNAPILSTVARVAILLLTGAIALRQMGLANEIIELAFGLILGAAAVAAAIAFGIGGREIAARQLQRWMSRFEGRSAASV